MKVKRSLKLKITTIAVSTLFTIGSFCYIFALIQSQKDGRLVYLEEVARQGAITMQKQIAGDFQTLIGIATFIGETNLVDPQELERCLTIENRKNSFLRMTFIFPDGVGYGAALDKAPINGADFSDRDYFKHALMGEKYLSAPFEDAFYGTMINTYAVPVTKGSTVIGVLAAIMDSNIYSDILDVSAFNGEGYSHLIKLDGSFVVKSQHPNADTHATNFFTDVSISSQEHAQVIADIKNGDSGIIEIKTHNMRKYASYTPVGVQDWYFVSIVPDSAISSDISRFIITAVAGVLIFTFIIMLLLYGINSIRRKSHREILHLAYYDDLTGSYNQYRFVMEAKKKIQQEKSAYTIMSLDINNFKGINDMFGFESGDQLLRCCADAIREIAGPGELFARASSDLFYILLKYTDDVSSQKRIDALMNKISSFELRGIINFNINCSCGIYHVLPADHHTDIKHLCDRANIARLHIKGYHTNKSEFYNDSLHEDEALKNEIELHMKHALEYREFEVFLQPQYDVETGQIVSSEALIRWNHPTRGRIPPSVFIPVLEENGFVVKLDMYVLEEVCKKLREWMDKGKTVTPIAVNQSRMHLYQPEYVKTLTSITERYAIPCNLIELEMTESMTLDNLERVKSITQTLHELGFSLSMDDFGSGYSSLNVLKDLNFDTLKLDRVFFEEAADTQRGRVVIKSVVSMARALSMRIVCEGIETAEQVDFVRETKCHTVQGYYYARPMPISEFERLAYDFI